MNTSSTKIVIYQIMTRLFGNTKSLNKTYGTSEENGVGKFDDINDKALAGIKALGVSHVWYTGIIEHASLADYRSVGIPLDDPDVVKGRAGSPFAIKDYYDVDPDLAVNVKDRIREFEHLVDRTHAHDLKVIIDFVPNHVARAYHSDAKPDGIQDLGDRDDATRAFSPDNNFYYLPGQKFQVPSGHHPLGSDPFPGKDGKFEENPAKVTGDNQFTPTPSIDSWFETVKLNYGIDFQHDQKKFFDPIPDTWTKMRDILVYWAGKKVDGFRCDMAEMVPVEFWNWVIPYVKTVNPEIIFIAEIYNPDQYRNYIENGRFDFLYDKVQLYDTLRLMVNGRAKSTAVAGIQESLNGINHHMLHFLENHDEQRIASPFFTGDPWKALPAMIITATIDRGPVMIYFGQEVGEKGAGNKGHGGEDGRTSVYDYWGCPEFQHWVNEGSFDGGQLDVEQRQLRQFYGDILSLALSNQAIQQGDYGDLTRTNVAAGNCSDKIVSFARAYNEERLVILASFNDKPERIRIQLTPEVIAAFHFGDSFQFIARDLLRSGIDTGLNDSMAFEIDVPAFGYYILKLK